MLHSNCLKRILEGAPGEPPKVEAVILYEDLTCGLRLKHAFDELFRDVFSRAGWAAQYRLSLWGFQMLQLRAISTAAAKESANAALFCVAVLGCEPLISQVVSLLQQWLAHTSGQPSAMVLAGYGNDPIELRGSPAGAYFRMAAKRAGKLFLVQPLGPKPIYSPVEAKETASLNVIWSRPAMPGGNALAEARIGARTVESL